MRSWNCAVVQQEEAKSTEESSCQRESVALWQNAASHPGENCRIGTWILEGVSGILNSRNPMSHSVCPLLE